MKFLSAYTDAKLLSLVKQGDKEAFDCIYKKYWDILFDQAFKRVKSKEDAEEIVQELFIYLWINREKIHVTHTLFSYLSTAVKYRVFNHVRRNIVEEKHLSSSLNADPKHIETVEESILYNDLRAAYEKEVKKLPERCREVYTLRREEDLSFKEIAEKLNISVNTVDKQLAKALKKLREKLKDYQSSLPFFSFNFFAVSILFLLAQL